MNKQRILSGKAKCLGWGFIDGSFGPVISITRCLIDGYRLIMWTDAGIWYAENNDIKEAAENYGVGLRLVEVREVEDEKVEAVFEPIPEAKPKPIYVNGIKRMPPAHAYILATDFSGEFGILLYREEQNGERTFLWGDDYIFK